MNHEKEKMFIKNLFNDVWTKFDASQLSNYYHKDVTLQMGKQNACYHDIEHRLEYVKNHYLSITNNIHDILVDGNKVVVYLDQTYVTKNNMNHTHALICIYDLENNKIKRAWACIDPVINYFE
ncbi:MAG: nuclear transport factor 2 family protein [Gammaproteobacteria bacterium]|nr:nuclear transport factor 2 family protein [Gammaproteobacteria bacterium]